MAIIFNNPTLGASCDMAKKQKPPHTKPKLAKKPSTLHTVLCTAQFKFGQLPIVYTATLGIQIADIGSLSTNQRNALIKERAAIKINSAVSYDKYPDEALEFISIKIERVATDFMIVTLRSFIPSQDDPVGLGSIDGVNNLCLGHMALL